MNRTGATMIRSGATETMTGLAKLRRHGAAKTFWTFAALVAPMASPALAQAPVVATGATPTSVTMGPGGGVNVGVAAPAAGGVSLNQYHAFSVPSAGLVLDNRRAGASTIVNEVVSPRRSLLSGVLSVEGPAAHVVVANPYGVTLDGARFVNVGGVAVGAASVGFTPAVGGGRNVVLTTSGADVTVTGAGLSGSIANLQLLAGRLKIDGPIVNAHPGQDATVGLTAGSYEATLEGSVFPGATATRWASLRNLGGASSEILIDVTPNGSVSASRVRMAVGPKGAGVSFAGKGMASIGEFSISADGKVSLPGGAAIQAEKAVKIRAASIDVLNGAAGQARLAAVSGGVTLIAEQGDVFVSGLVQGVARDRDDADSRGGVTVDAAGSIRLLSERADRLAILFSRDDDLWAKAGVDVVNDAGRILSNQRTFVTAAGRVDNRIDVVGAIDGGAPVVTRSRGKRSWLPWFGRTRGLRVVWTAGERRLPGQLAYIVGASTFLRAAEVVNAGEIDALEGALSIDAERIRVVAALGGSASFERRCGLTCSGRGSSSVSASGGAVNVAGSARLTASQEIVSEGGLVVAYGNLSLDAPKIVGRALFAPSTIRRPTGLYNGFSGKDVFLALQPSGGQFLAPVGLVEVSGGRPALDGGLIAGGAGVVAPLGVDQIWPVQARGGILLHEIGALRGLL